MSAIYKEPLSVLKRLLFVAMIVLGMTMATSTVDAARIISGTVYNDTDGNANANTISSGAAFKVGGGTIALYNGATEVASSSIAADGTYSITAPAGTAFTLKVKSPAAGYVAGPDVAVTQLDNSDQTKNVFVRGTRGAISGRIFNDATLGTNPPNGIYDAGEALLSGVTVILKKNGTQISKIESDGTTGYSFKNLPALGAGDTYTIEILETTLPATVLFTTSSDGSTNTPKTNITLTTFTTSVTNKNFANSDKNLNGISGTVFIDMNDDQAYTSTEDEALAGATVTIYYGDGVTQVRGFSPQSSLAIPLGKYEFSPLPMGKYIVKLSTKTGFLLQVGSRPVDVVASGTYGGQDLGYKGDPSNPDPNRGNMSGFIFGESAATVGGGLGPDAGPGVTGVNIPTEDDTRFPLVEVKLYKSTDLINPFLTQKTNSFGRYTFNGIPAGNYVVKIPTTDPAGWYYINDADGKSPTPMGGGPANAPYEIKVTLAAKATVANRNFWFGTGDGFIRIDPRISGYNNWGGMVNTVTTLGWAVAPMSFDIFEADGVTRAKKADGTVITTVSGTGNAGTGMHRTAPRVRRGAYILRPVSQPTGLTPQGVNALINGYAVYNHTAGGTFTPYYAGDSSIKGRVFLNLDGILTGGKADYNPTAGDRGAHQMRIRLYNVTDGYEAWYTGLPADGSFNFSNLPPRKYRITIDLITNMAGDLGNQIVFENNSDLTGANPIEIDLTAGNIQKTDLNIWFKPINTKHQISGVVWQDTYGDSVITRSANGIFDNKLAGVKVELLDAFDAPILNGGIPVQATTGGDGKFLFKELAGENYLISGKTYHIRISKAEFTNVDSLGPATRTVTLPATVSVYPEETFLMQSGYSISGQSFVDLNGDKIKNGSDYTTADGNGDFYLQKHDGTSWVALARRSQWSTSTSFTSLEPGKYRIYTTWGTLRDDDPITAVGQSEITLTPTKKTGAVKFLSAIGAQGISGGVYLDVNGNGIIDPEDILFTDGAGIKIKHYDLPQFYPEYNTAADLSAAIGNPRNTITLTGTGLYDLTTNIISGRNILSLDQTTIPSGYSLINNSDNAVPTHEDLPASLKDRNTLDVKSISGATAYLKITNKDFLLKRDNTAEISGYALFDVDYDGEMKSPGDLPLTGAVIVLEKSGTPIASYTVGSDGKYQFSNLLTGSYTVKFTDPNGAVQGTWTQAFASTNKTRNYTVTPAGLIARDENFYFNAPGVKGIAGQVVVDVNNNGAVDSNDIKMVGVTVTLTNGAGVPINLGNPALNPVTTGSAGTFQFISLPAGSYKVQISGTPLNAYNVYKTATATTTLKEIAITLGTTDSMKANQYFLLAGKSNNSPGSGPGAAANASGISGFLYKGATSNEAGVPAGDFFANRQINLYDSAGNFITRTYTDANGKYQFYNLPLGNFKVKAEDIPNGLALSTPEEKNLNVPIGGLNKQNYWLAEISANGVKFEVKYNANHSGTTSGLDVLVPDIVVELWLPGGTSALYSETTDANGAVEFKNIGALTYNVRFNTANLSGKGYQGLTPAYNLTVPQGGAPVQLLLLDGIRTFSGKIQKDTTGDGIIDTGVSGIESTLIWAGPDNAFNTPDDVKFGSVALTGSVTVTTGKTDGDGLYSYTKLPNGNFRVAYNAADPAFTGFALMVKTGNTAPPRDVVNVSADKTDANFDYEPLATLEGTIRYDLNGNGAYNDTAPTIDPGIGGIALTLWKEGSTSGTYVQVSGKTATTSVVAGSIGSYKFENLTYGKYYVQIDKTKIPNYKLIWTGQDGTITNDRVYGTLSATAATKINWNALYGADPAKTTTVTIETRSDSDSTPGYSAGDAMFAGIPVTVYAKDASNNTLFFGTVTTSSTIGATYGTASVKLPYGTYKFVADEANALNGVATAVYDNDGSPFGTVDNRGLAATTDKVYFGYKSNEAGGGNYTLSGNVSRGPSYAAGNPDLDGVVLQLFRESTINGVTGYVYVKDVTTGTVTSGDYSFTGLKGGKYRIVSNFAATNTAYKIISGYNNTATEVKDITISANTTHNIVYNLDPAKSRTVDFMTLMDDKLDGKRAGDTTPAKNIVLEITGGGLTNQLLTTSNLGTATFALAHGTYTIKVKNSAPANELDVVYNTSGDNLTDPASRTMSFVVAADSKVPFFGFKKKATPPNATDKEISGRVVDLATGTGYQGTDAGLNGIAVLLEQEIGTAGSGNWAPVRTYTTSGNGTYTTAKMPINKNYRVSIAATQTAAAQAIIAARTLKIPAALGSINGNLPAGGITTWHFGYIPGSVPPGTFQNVTITTRNDNGTTPDNYDTGDALLGAVKVSLRNASGTYVIDLAQGAATGTLSGAAKGIYTFKNLPQDTYTVTFVVPNKMTRAYKYKDTTKDTTNSDSITFTVGAATPPALLAGFKANIITGAYEISGKIVYDNGATVGSVDTTDLPIKNIGLVLEVYDSANSKYIATSKTAQTDNTGSYKFTGLGNDKYRVVVANGIDSKWVVSFDGDAIKDGKREVTVNNSSQINQDFGYIGYSAGAFPNDFKDLKIESRSTTDTAYQSTDPFLANVGIQLTPPSGSNLVFPAVTSGTSGSYTYKNLPIGSYNVTVTNMTGYNLVYASKTLSTNTITVPLTTGSTVTTTEYFGFQLDISGTNEIKGRVVFDTGSVANTYDADDNGIIGVPVKLQYDPGTGFQDTGKTDTTKIAASGVLEGEYKFTGIKLDGTGKYRVVVDNTNALIAPLTVIWDTDGIGGTKNHNIEGALTTNVDNWHFVYKASGATGTNLTIQTRYDSIANNAYDATDAIEGNVSVQVVGQGLNTTVVTNASTGNVSLNGVPMGNYTLTVTEPTGLKVVYHTSAASSNTAQTFTATSPNATAHFGFGIKPPTPSTRTINGRVVLDSNGNNHYNASDAGIKDAELRVEYRISTGPDTYRIVPIGGNINPQKTGVNGVFNFASMPEGYYRISVVGGTPTNSQIIYTGGTDGGNDSTTPITQAVIERSLDSTVASQNNWNYGYRTNDGSSLTVNVRFDSNFSGAVAGTESDGKDPFQAGVPVTVTNGTITHTFTSDDTTKLLSNMPYGTYTISVNLAGTNYAVAYDPLAGTSNSVNFTSSSANKVADYGVKVKLAPPGTGKTISGRVVLDSDTTYAGTESGLNNIPVSIYQQNGTDWLLVHPTATTTGTGAVAGSYSFGDLVAGQTYKVMVNAGMTAKYTKEGANPENTSVTEISKVVNTDEAWIYAYAGQYFLEGYVSFDTDRSRTLKQGMDIVMDGVKVKAETQINGVTVSVPGFTDGAGKYKIEGLTAGTWTVSIDNFGTNYTGTYDYSYVDGQKNTLDSDGLSTNTYTSYSATVGAGVPNADHNFGLYGDGKIEGKMLIDTNGTGLYDPADEAHVLTIASYIKVTDQVGNADFVPYYIKTKPDGSYVIPYLIPDFHYQFEGKVGNVPNGITPFLVLENYVKTSYHADTLVAGSSLPTVTTSDGNIAVQRQIPAATTTFNLATARIAFRSTYTVDGRLLIDVNANGVYDPGIDVPIDGETVRAVANDTTAGILDATSATGASPVAGDPSGFYQFVGLSGPLVGDGKWNIKVDPFTTPMAANLTLSFESTENPSVLDNNQLIDFAQGSKSSVNFGYVGAASIAGTVEQLVGTSNLPLGNVVVELYDNKNNLLKNTTTDAMGAYSFTKLSDHNTTGIDYVVKVKMNQPTLTPMEYLSGLTPETANVVYSENVTLNDSLVTTVVNPTTFVVKPRVSYAVSGFVFQDSNDDGQVTTTDPTEIALLGATMTITNNAGVLVGTPAIGADGSYTLADLPAGQYTLTVSGVNATTHVPSFDPNDGYSKGTLPTTPHVATIAVGAPITNLNFGYIFSGTAKVVVRNVLSGSYTTAEPGLANAEVEVHEGTVSGTLVTNGLTDAAGFVNFRNLDTSKTFVFVVPFGSPNNTNPSSPLQQVEYVIAGIATAGTVPIPGDTSGTAAVSAGFGGGTTITDAQVYFGFVFNNYKVTVTKTALKDSAHVGEFVPYRVTITSNESKPIPGMILKDLIPAGFKYVQNSARVTDPSGARTGIAVSGSRPIEITLGTLNPGEKVTVNYILVVGAGVTPGDYVNKAHTVTFAGFQNSNTASATVKVTGDPLFDDSLIFGKVFHDKNRNGRQEKEEPGVGGVKLVTARGDIITTDEHGRYHLADVSGGRWERGTNFILKLDTRSLQQGLTTTTENPIVVRLSPGLPSRINFGVEVPPPVAARLAEQLALAKAEEVKKIEEKLQKEEKFVVESIHFAFDRDQIEPEFENTLDSLAEVLRLHPEWKIRIEGHTDSLGTETYNKDLSQRRANAVKTYLLKTGVNSAQLVDAVGLGLSEPVADNGTPEGRYKNRRVEFKLEK